MVVIFLRQKATDPAIQTKTFGWLDQLFIAGNELFFLPHAASFQYESVLNYAADKQTPLMA